MSLTSPEDIQAWFEAVQLYDAGKIEESIEKFYEVSLQNSRILFNLGCCFLTLNDTKLASRKYTLAVDNDQHLAVGFFMRGLTSYLHQDYKASMQHFEQAKVLLRGNKYLDYKQLGLNFQLYECEILSNQAVMTYHLGDIDLAKEYLLKAVSSKAEKKHEKITEMLHLIQSGEPIVPFNPPQSQIFRPPKSYVNNLKKKDYLGKSKVLSTENEEIYACFSGIKKDIINNNNKPVPVAKPKPLNRVAMLDDIRADGRRKTLRKTVRIELPESDVNDDKSSLQPRGRAMTDSSLNVKKKTRSRSPCPPRAKLPPPPPKTIDKNHEINDSLDELHIDEQENSPENSPTSMRIPKTQAASFDQCVDDNNNKPFSSFRSLDLPRERLQSCPLSQKKMDEIRSRKKSLPQQPSEELDIKSDEIAAQRMISQNNYGNLGAPPSLPSTPVDENKESVFTGLYSTFRSAKKSKQKSERKLSLPERSNTLEIEVQYNYIKKITIPDGCSFGDIQEIIQRVTVPKEIDLCFNDAIGRQQQLNSNNFKDVLGKTKLFCFPASTYG